MATLGFLPATTYNPNALEQARAGQRKLNTIIENSESSENGSPTPEPHIEEHTSYRLATWLSPLSDHFPTPRGNHFMSAPYIPASPSTTGESEASGEFSILQTRDSFGTQMTEFDELYDVSSDEEMQRHTRKAQVPSLQRQKASSRLSNTSSRSRGSLPSLVIPSADNTWESVTAFKKLTSPVPPTPPPKIPMSPAIFRFLKETDLPSSSAPPSLDGSLTSEQMAAISAPPTPNIGNEPINDAWGGVQLQPAAMATLQALSAGDEVYEPQTERVIELPPRSPTLEMQQSPPPVVSGIRRNNSVVLSPDQQQSLNSLTRLEIPSPRDFFSSLSSSCRHTWHTVPFDSQAEAPPTSTTAENFYMTPWSTAPVERVLEVRDMPSDGCPTARPIFTKKSSDETIICAGSLSPVEEEGDATEIIADYDETYVERLKNEASENIGWTTRWLTAQTDYLSELINPVEDRDDEVALQRRNTIRAQPETPDALDPLPSKKTVRFSEVPSTGDGSKVIGCPLPSLSRIESVYHQSFYQYIRSSRSRDVFVHSQPRFEALQIQRVNLAETHRNQLLGKYQLSVVPMSPKKRMSANVARGDDTMIEDPAKIKADRIREAISQMSAASWAVQAAKFLNGGSLLPAPVARRLARLSFMDPLPNGTPRDRAKILDLGGQATCDWAWQCAIEYPNAKVFSVTTKALRQASNSNIKGPGNHRQVDVNRLVKLPFKDNQFDLISARSLYSVLKISSENGMDEYQECLKECLRCLKPGGYLDFTLMDSDIMLAGPKGQAKSVEFGFSLKTRGYDAAPTKAWLRRLHDGGFVNIKRMWMFLPMGSPVAQSSAWRDSMGMEKPMQLDALVSGSTAAAASITGLVGTWAWEKWMLKMQMENGRRDEGLLEGVSDVVEEGRGCGAGWRVLQGWARKPVSR